MYVYLHVGDRIVHWKVIKVLNSRLTITGANDDSNGHTLTNEEPTLSDKCLILTSRYQKMLEG